MSHSLLLFIRVMARALIWIWKQTKSSGMKFSDDGGETFRFSFYKISIKKLNIHIKSFEKLTAKAAIEGNRETALFALTMNPLVQDEALAKALLEELMEAHPEYLPQFYK